MQEFDYWCQGLVSPRKAQGLLSRRELFDTCSTLTGCYFKYLLLYLQFVPQVEFPTLQDRNKAVQHQKTQKNHFFKKKKEKSQRVDLHGFPPTGASFKDVPMGVAGVAPLRADRKMLLMDAIRLKPDTRRIWLEHYSCSVQVLPCGGKRTFSNHRLESTSTWCWSWLWSLWWRRVDLVLTGSAPQRPRLSSAWSRTRLVLILVGVWNLVLTGPAPQWTRLSTTGSGTRLLTLILVLNLDLVLAGPIPQRLGLLAARSRTGSEVHVSPWTHAAKS